MKKILDKLVCLHKWNSHVTSRNFREDKTTEVLICEHCGKIRKIEY